MKFCILSSTCAISSIFYHYFNRRLNNTIKFLIRKTIIFLTKNGIEPIRGKIMASRIIYELYLHYLSNMVIVTYYLNNMSPTRKSDITALTIALWKCIFLLIVIYYLLSETILWLVLDTWYEDLQGRVNYLQKLLRCLYSCIKKRLSPQWFWELNHSSLEASV